MKDEQILDLFWTRSEQAILETEKKYGRYCYSIAYQILLDEEDVKEVLNDTYLKVWNTIPPQHPSILKSYVGMISRQLALNFYEKQHTQKTRNLFVRRYWYMSSISEIAEDFSMKESNVTMHLLRTRKKLEKFLIKEGFVI